MQAWRPCAPRPAFWLCWLAGWLQGTWDWLKLDKPIDDFHWMERATEHVMQYMEVRSSCAGACKQDGTWMVENLNGSRRR